MRYCSVLNISNILLVCFRFDPLSIHQGTHHVWCWGRWRTRRRPRLRPHGHQHRYPGGVIMLHVFKPTVTSNYLIFECIVNENSRSWSRLSSPTVSPAVSVRLPRRLTSVRWALSREIANSLSLTKKTFLKALFDVFWQPKMSERKFGNENWIWGLFRHRK